MFKKNNPGEMLYVIHGAYELLKVSKLLYKETFFFV